ncbi:hypothetical protein OKW45_001580 [Paraburkholderia sp. WSM4175]|uniref:hypothetical protein n=1 Tax=Paraburkholderia sp. WSM4175 TaxID=2991072 RepID=UPI003D22A4B5
MDEYAPALCDMSDEETPYLLTLAHAALSLGLTALLEVSVGVLFNRIVQHRGRLAVPSTLPGNVLAYLHATTNGDYSAARSLVARPLESFALALLLAARCGLADDFDLELRNIDHRPLNVFILHRFRDFGRLVIRGGRNHVRVERNRRTWRSCRVGSARKIRSSA